jgi:hypothetical protein
VSRHTLPNLVTEPPIKGRILRVESIGSSMAAVERLNAMTREPRRG